MTNIIITGTPCTGKTTLGKKLSLLLKKELISITELVKKEGLSEEYDKVRQTYPVDIKRLKKVLERYDNMIIEGHLSHYLDPKHVSLAIVCRTNLKELNKRLIARNYTSQKIRENLDSEIFEICLTEAREQGHEVYEIWTDDTRSLEEGILFIKGRVL